jgi:2-polyprenyl-3-methyl-5-hydroxy-6-metoxy-1,4-benzoquinol methylase
MKNSFSNQVLNDDDRKSIRKDVYKRSENRLNKVSSSDKKISFFQKYAKNKSVLDLGSIDHNPENRFTEFWLFQALINVADSIIGLDYYEDGVNELKEQGYDIALEDAQNFDLNRIFEVITAGDIIEHLPNPGLMFECVSKHLDEGGIFVLSTPNVFCWKYVFHFWLLGHSNRVNKEHVTWFCPSMLRLLASRYNFECVELEFSSRRRWENWIMLPRQLKHTTISMSLVKRNAN